MEGEIRDDGEIYSLARRRIGEEEAEAVHPGGGEGRGGEVSRWGRWGPPHGLLRRRGGTFPRGSRGALSGGEISRRGAPIFFFRGGVWQVGPTGGGGGGAEKISGRVTSLGRGWGLTGKTRWPRMGG